MAADEKIFESEVRRVASIRWPTSAGSVPQQMLGRERDAVIVTDEIVHIIEATTSLKKAKS
jgi:hypothetical protein